MNHEPIKKPRSQGKWGDPKYRKEYWTKHKWLAHRVYSMGRARLEGIPHTLTKEQVKILWDRDNGGSLKRPSIDKIIPKLGYVFENCRFIELSENCHLAGISQITTPKRRQAARNNLRKWAIANPDYNSISVSVQYPNGNMSTFKSMTKAAESLGVSKSSIARVARGIRSHVKGCKVSLSKIE